MSRLETYMVDAASVIVDQPSRNIYALGKEEHRSSVMKYVGIVFPKGEIGGIRRGVAIDQEQSLRLGSIVYDHTNRGWWEVAGFDEEITGRCKLQKKHREDEFIEYVRQIDERRGR